MWVIYFSNMIQFVMLWKVNFFNKTNGLKIAPVYIWQRIECLSKDHLVPNFELFQGFVFNPIFHWVRKFDRFLSEWIADLSNELYLMHFYSWIFNQSYFQPCSFLFLSGPSGVFMSPWLSPCSRICPLLFVSTVSHGKKSFHYTTSV